MRAPFYSNPPLRFLSLSLSLSLSVFTLSFSSSLNLFYGGKRWSGGRPAVRGSPLRSTVPPVVSCPVKRESPLIAGGRPFIAFQRHHPYHRPISPYLHVRPFSLRERESIHTLSLSLSLSSFPLCAPSSPSRREQRKDPRYTLGVVHRSYPLSYSVASRYPDSGFGLIII